MYDTWKELELECKNCTKCKLCNTRNKVVIGGGNKNANVMFIGEGPGEDEDLEGNPFVGKARKAHGQSFGRYWNKKR